MLPCVNGTAITINCSQGMTLKFVVLNVGKNEFVRQLLYVAITRVTEVEGIIFDTEFSSDRLTPNDSLKDVVKEELRLKGLELKDEEEGFLEKLFNSVSSLFGKK